MYISVIKELCCCTICGSRRSDMTQRLKVVPSSVAYDIAGDYFQALRHITAPAAQMVTAAKFLIITPEWEYSS